MMMDYTRNAADIYFICKIETKSKKKSIGQKSGAFFIFA